MFLVGGLEDKCVALIFEFQWTEYKLASCSRGNIGRKGNY